MAYKSAKYILLFIFSSFLISCGHEWNNPCDQSSPSYSESECNIQQRGCPDDCLPAGSRQCSGNGYQVCGNTDEDECLEWGTVTACGTDETCSNGRCLTPPSTPSNLNSSVVSSSQISLSWTDNSNNEDGFKIERKIGSGGTYAQAVTVETEITNYLDTGLTCGTTYYYRIRAYNGAGDSSYSSEVNTTTGVCPPSNLQAIVVSSSQINLSWTDNSNDENGFNVERKTGAGGTYSVVYTAPPNTTTWSDTGLSAGTTYCYRVYAISSFGNSDYSNEVNAVGSDKWNLISLTGNPSAREYHTAVWTGTEMIIWGGHAGSSRLNTGDRYNPSTDSWTPTSTGANVPSDRWFHTAVWTGSEMIIWGGRNPTTNTGGKYNPATDSWTPTCTEANVPTGRMEHIAVWTGSEMIVWGGKEDINYEVGINTGGRYNPSTDSWLPTSTGANVPAGRIIPTAVWTGTEMIIWGGYNDSFSLLNTGGRYNPSTDSWIPTSTGINIPVGRWFHTAVWTGTEMIVWGGQEVPPLDINTGSKYNPSTNSWTPTSTSGNIPSARHGHTAVWTGKEMIIWGAAGNTGGKYNPSTDSWTPTSTGANVPTGRTYHTAVWTGSEMIIWGGTVSSSATNSGGRYSP